MSGAHRRAGKSYRQVPLWLQKPDYRCRPQKGCKPSNLPRKAPACFDSQAQWDLYRVPAVVSAPKNWNYCQDCTAERRDEMHAQGRCKFPGTTFKIINGIIRGFRVQ